MHITEDSNKAILATIDGKPTLIRVEEQKGLFDWFVRNRPGWLPTKDDADEIYHINEFERK